jgi:hypothetical protein
MYPSVLQRLRWYNWLSLAVIGRMHIRMQTRHVIG